MKGFPPIYKAPNGVPLNWQDEDVGDLKAAVMVFLFGQKLTDEQFQKLHAYLVYHIHAPCWLENNAGGPLHPDLELRVRELRARAQAVLTAVDAWAYLAACMEVGLDPL